MDIKTRICSTKNLISIHKIETTLTFNKPIYVRMYILELNKVTMYEFYYDYIKRRFGNK